MKRFLPLALFGALVGFALWGLLIREDRDALPSALIAKPAPDFTLPAFGPEGGEVQLSKVIAGEPIVLNYWASWCGPCRVEHPDLMRLNEMGVQIVGVNYKDEAKAAARFLRTLGDPFAAIAVDKTGRTAIDYGVAALPETFVISAAGEIIYKHVGPINPGELEGKLIPAIERARAR